MDNYGMQLFVQLANLATAIVAIYCLFSIPAQIIRRFRLKKQGRAVTPMLIIFRKLLKYWFFTALVVIPFSVIVSYKAVGESGVSESMLFALLVQKAVIGNFLTTLLFAYVLMKSNKTSWSYSAREERDQRELQKNSE